MKYYKIIITYLFISMIGSIYAQDNIINEIADGGKFIVRDVEQNEAMVIEDGNVGFSGTLKLGVLPKGEAGNSIVVWDPKDKLLKIQNQRLSTGSNNDFKDWHTFDYNGLASDNITPISASVQSTATVSWNVLSTDFGYISFGPSNQYDWANIYTDKSRFLLNKDLFTFGSFGSYYDRNLNFKTGHETRLTILHDNGNVGIGTNNPSTKLDVAGQVKITGGTPGYGKVLTSDATGLASWQTPAAGGGSTLWTESGSNLYRTGGNIGIGISNPSTKLDVSGQVKIRGGTPGSGKVLTSDATGLASWQTPAAGSGGSFWTESGSNIYRNGGKVGIGIKNPTQPLQISATGWQGVELIHSVLAGGTGGMRWTGTTSYHNRSWLMFTNDTPTTSGSGNDGGLMFRTNNGTNGGTPYPRMVIAQNGNVGIGTTNPRARLEVAGQVKITGGTPGNGKVLTSDATGLATWQSLTAGGGVTLWTESGSNLFRTSGNIGIGTTNPSVKLDVNGSAIIGDNTASSFLHVGDNYYSTIANSLNPGVYLYKNGLISYGLKLQYTGSEYGTMMFGPNVSNTFLSFGKVGTVLEDDNMIEYMRVDLDNGNVGISTANPSAKLDVNGTVSAKRYVVDGLYDITNGVWDLSRGNLAQVTYNSSVTPITINSNGSAGTYVLVVKKNASCTDCTINFVGADVKYPSGVIPTLSSGSNTTDIFSFIAIGNNTFYCLYAKNLL